MNQSVESEVHGMNAEEYKEAANYWKAKERKEMPASQLRPFVEDFLRSNSVCALATGAGDYVRCTPLEYSFHDGEFWIFTEGGEKFIGLEKNANVSLAVFDANPSFGELRSVQVMGAAAIVEPMSAAYVAHAEHKKIPVAALQKLPDQGRPMHLLRIRPSGMDALFSEFKKQGYDARQVLSWD